MISYYLSGENPQYSKRNFSIAKGIVEMHHINDTHWLKASAPNVYDFIISMAVYDMNGFPA